MSAAVESEHLREPERRAVESLRATGIAIASFEELIGDAALWDALADAMGAFAMQARERAPGAVHGPTRKDDYLVRRFRDGAAPSDGAPVVRLRRTDPFLRLGAADPLLNVVNGYRGAGTRLVDLDAWYTVPFEAAEQRVASQRWHRDPEDLHVVKVFIYFSDVGDDAGPFEYVAGSATAARRPPRGPLGSLHLPWNRRRLYPSRRYVDRRVAGSEVITVTGAAGTVIFCDTSGLHRGGFARRTPRLLTYHTYVSPESGTKRTFAVEGAGDPALSDAGRFALG